MKLLNRNKLGLESLFTILSNSPVLHWRWLVLPRIRFLYLAISPLIKIKTSSNDSCSYMVIHSLTYIPSFPLSRATPKMQITTKNENQKKISNFFSEWFMSGLFWNLCHERRRPLPTITYWVLWMSVYTITKKKKNKRRRL